MRSQEFRYEKKRARGILPNFFQAVTFAQELRRIVPDLNVYVFSELSTEPEFDRLAALIHDQRFRFVIPKSQFAS
jgi:hypothetical protein